MLFDEEVLPGGGWGGGVGAELTSKTESLRFCRLQGLQQLSHSLSAPEFFAFSDSTRRLWGVHALMYSSAFLTSEMRMRQYV